FLPYITRHHPLKILLLTEIWPSSWECSDFECLDFAPKNQTKSPSSWAFDALNPWNEIQVLSRGALCGAKVLTSMVVYNTCASLGTVLLWIYRKETSGRRQYGSKTVYQHKRHNKRAGMSSPP